MDPCKPTVAVRLRSSLCMPPIAVVAQLSILHLMNVKSYKSGSGVTCDQRWDAGARDVVTGKTGCAPT
jgi:hypothetical protein